MAAMAAAVTLKPGASRVFRVRKTCLKMLSKRGYNVGEDELNMTAGDFAARFGDDPPRESMKILVSRTDDENDQVLVFFPTDEKVGVKPIQSITDQMQQLNVARAIIIVRHDVTSFAKQAIQVCTKVNLEVWREAELLVDITEHKLVPEHEVLGDEDKLTLLKRYRLKEAQLPRIQAKDPVARYYGMQRGQVVKITRDSETAGRYVTYRICL
uniref:DNA-directed RNA polymerases I, II, and III subunit RPABC1 n=1 Tax=Rhizochromulina marina TaxID=1034831 RepID=A0A7S2WK41_9STRA|mmetsp:Transcript_25981/g.75776  ORF Transcript_25981/g.75776 Transcript_25981/m.75776 type:complete len:212 (+) Transcript_25981:102-737(+)|eukprot:CAMPEP_0118963784 /NCGR_PEP_ID=MMETSP1173-20130426/1598_1 /TAXON_ID=1034831 /ORGANISM="Rhizochromulina marina cf, Strain CCMP1243" /LENGTH=211 /DNA_ID=CAMNT_0006912161 /DNA_START=19 /DNA_END=654 /DNA_ORIENTATION=+